MTHKRECRTCRKTFITTDSRKLYCSEECRKKWRAKYKHKWYKDNKKRLQKASVINSDDEYRTKKVAAELRDDYDYFTLKRIGLID